MANEKRVRNDNVQGTLSSTMNSTQATMNSAGLANLEAISSTEHAAICIDPARTAGAPEIVWVTAHTGSATSATISRGKEGTAARAHSSTEEWVHAPTVGGGGTAGDFPTRHGVILRRAANQSFGDGSLDTVSWDTEDQDTDGFISVTGTTITIPTGLGGVYSISTDIVLASAPDNRFFVNIVAAGRTWRTTGSLNQEEKASLSVVVALAAADTVTVQVFQDHTGAQNGTARLEMFRISD